MQKGFLCPGASVRLLVGLSGGRWSWSWGESGVGTSARLQVGVGLNSTVEGMISRTSLN